MIEPQTLTDRALAFAAESELACQLPPDLPQTVSLEEGACT
jgi:hypothetical protein